MLLPLKRGLCLHPVPCLDLIVRNGGPALWDVAPPDQAVAADVLLQSYELDCASALETK